MTVSVPADIETPSGNGHSWADAAQFNHNVRQSWQLSRVGGPCVLDFSKDNAAEFGLGGMLAVISDLHAAGLPNELQDDMMKALVELDIDDAFGVRRELINYKKVMHHVVMRITSSERDLRQLAALLYCQQDNVEEQSTYRELAQILQNCRGCQQACMDVRSLTRAVCCLPRHRPSEVSDKSDPWQPFSLALGQVRRALGRHEPGLLTAQKCEDQREPLPGMNSGCKASLELASLLQRKLVAWPPHVINYVDLCLVARGVDKALRIRAELFDLMSAVKAARVEIATLVASATALSTLPLPHDREVEVSVDARRRLTYLEGLDGIAADAEIRLYDMLAGKRAFIAGDRCVGTVPRDWAVVPAALRSYDDAKHRFAHSAEQLLVRVGWPPPEGSIKCDVIGDTACSHCGGRFRPLWVHRGACFSCAGRRRRDGQCPYRECPQCVVCPHSARCMACEEWSCHQCRLLRLDGEGVAALVDTVKPWALFLDFCQTLATTKRGQPPIQGVHFLQPDLAEVARQHENVHVITRNRHVQEIREFLDVHGLGHVAVHSTKREGKTKGEFIAAVFEGSDRIENHEAVSSGKGKGPAVFVDDDIAEHTKLEIRSMDLDRIIFQHTTH